MKVNIITFRMIVTLEEYDSERFCGLLEINAFYHQLGCILNVVRTKIKQVGKITTNNITICCFPGYSIIPTCVVPIKCRIWIICIFTSRDMT